MNFPNFSTILGPYTVIALTFAMAWLVEAFVEYFIGKLADQFPKLGAYKWTLPYVAVVVAVPLAFFYKIDVITLVTGSASTWVGITLTGLLISRGAGVVNDFLSFLTGKMKLPEA